MFDAPFTRRLLAVALAATAVFGPLLGPAAAGAAPVPVTDQRLATQSFDTQLAAQVQAVLDRTAGPGHAVVQVNAVLDFTGVSSREQMYVHTTSMPPVAANVSKQSYSAATGSGRSTSATVDNALGVVSRTVQNAPGRVSQLHVVVLLDRTSTARSGSVRSVRSLVQAAVGFTAKRGDTLSVQSMAFASTTPAPTVAAPARTPQRWNVVTICGAGLIAALLVVLVLVNRRRRPKRR